MKLGTHRLVFLALLVAVGTSLHLVEALLPIPLPLPGVKLGLANIVTLMAIYLYGFRDGLTVALLRVLLGSLLGGVFLSPAFLLGATGAIASTIVMALLVRYTRCFSAIGISMAGAVGHNVGQLSVASLLLGSSATFYYLPLLLLAGIPTGLFTGFLLKSLLEECERSGVMKGFTQP